MTYRYRNDSYEYGEDEKGIPYRHRPLAFLRDHDSPAWDEARQIVKDCPKFFDLPNYFAHSDYSGSLVEASNYRVWKQTYADLEGKNWYDLGASKGIFVRLNLLTVDQKECLDALDGYPLIDESDYSELECEQESEDWESYGEGDFRDSLEDHAEVLSDENELEEVKEALENASSEALRRFYWKLCQDAGHYAEFEAQSTVYRFEELLRPRKRYRDDPPVWDGSLSQLEDYLYGLVSTDSDGVTMWLADPETCAMVRVLRETDYVRDDVNNQLRPYVNLSPCDTGEPRAILVEQRETVYFDGE